MADGRARWVGYDVAEQSQVKAAVQLAISQFGSSDVMVNNAGICVLGLLATVRADDFDRMIAANLMGAFHGIQARI